MTEYNYFLFVSKIAKIRGCATTPGGIQELRAGAICKPREPFQLQRWGSVQALSSVIKATAN